MNESLLVSIFMTLIGLWLAGFGLATRHRPGLIAGFDPSRCSDVRGLSRWLGNGGVILGCLCILEAISTFMMPNRRPAISAALSIATIVTVVVIVAGARRFRLTQS